MGAKRLFASGLAASGAGALWSALVFTVALISGTDIWRAPERALALFFIAFLYSAIICVVLTWTIGLIWHIAAISLNWRSFAAYVAAGTAFGVSIALLTVPQLEAQPLSGMFLMIYVASCAVVVSAIGWFIRRPDRDAPNPDRAAP